MNINTARVLIQNQNSCIRILHGKRFNYKGFEYEVRYEGGFATFVSLYRREIGKRNFKYFNGTSCADCIGTATAMEKLKQLLPV